MTSHCTDCLDARSPVSPAAAPSPAVPDDGHAHWSAIASLTLGVFGLVTAEFLPASLLTAMAADLGISAGAAGQTVTATALVGAVAAPSIPLLTRRFDRRAVMVALTLLLVLSNLLAVSASSLGVLLAARVILGVALGGFWSMAAALAMRLVPERLFARAMSVILAGVSVATVCAAPLGAWMGEVWGWRSAFVAAGALSLVTLATQVATLPALPPKDNPDLRVLGELLTRPGVRVALLAVLLVISGHFAGFTYVRPFLEQVPALKIDIISLVLLAYGIGGFFGNLVGGVITARSAQASVITGGVMIAITSFVLVAFGASPWIAAIGVAFWGFAFGAIPVGVQTWIVKAAPDQPEGASGLVVAAFQIAIASGAVLGGLLVDTLGPTGVIGYCGLATLLGAALVLGFGRKAAA